MCQLDRLGRDSRATMLFRVEFLGGKEFKRAVLVYVEITSDYTLSAVASTRRLKVARLISSVTKREQSNQIKSNQIQSWGEKETTKRKRQKQSTHTPKFVSELSIQLFTYTVLKQGSVSKEERKYREIVSDFLNPS